MQPVKTTDQAIQKPSRMEQGKPSVVSYENIARKAGIVVTMNLIGAEPVTAANYDVFFTAPRPVEIMEVWETHRVASNSGTVNLEILASGVALDSGNTVLKTALSTAGTANTPQSASGFALTSNRILLAGERLALKDAGTLTNSAGLSITVYLKYANKGDYY